MEWNPATLATSAAPVSLGSITAIVLGLGTLFAGFVVSSAVNYVVTAFRVNGGVGALTGLIAVVGLALVSWGLWREIRGYLALAKWEEGRQALGDSAPVEPAKKIVARWVASVRDARIDGPAINDRLGNASDCREIRGILERHVLSTLDQRAEELRFVTESIL